MAGSKYAYVKGFELPDVLLPETYIVLRLDGHAFHRFSEAHDFAKPNDERALQLMDRAAQDVMAEFKDIVLGYGESDEYSFLFRKSTTLYNRRSTKIVTIVTSLFTSAYVFHWHSFFSSTRLEYPPSFDGRAILYPSVKQIRDYFSWRQVDTHVNNLYNTAFWAIVQQGGQTTTEAHAVLKGTASAQKHELLHTKFGINYNQVSERYRKGSVLVRDVVQVWPLLSRSRTNLPGEISSQPNLAQSSNGDTNTAASADHTAEALDVDARDTNPHVKGSKLKTRMELHMLHCDIISDEFWAARPWLL